MTRNEVIIIPDEKEEREKSKTVLPMPTREELIKIISDVKETQEKSKFIDATPLLNNVSI